MKYPSKLLNTLCKNKNSEAHDNNYKYIILELYKQLKTFGNQVGQNKSSYNKFTFYSIN